VSPKKDSVEITITDWQEIKVLIPCLLAAGIPHCLGNGTGPRLVFTMDAADDARLLELWNRLTELRIQYLEARQSQRVEQLSFLEGSEEAVVL